MITDVTPVLTADLYTHHRQSCLGHRAYSEALKLAEAM